MADDASASTQYGDLQGTLSIDGFDGLRAQQLVVSAEIPKGYHPIGLRISGSKRDRKGQLSVRARVLCVDTDQTGDAPDDIRRFGREQGELHTFAFDAEVSIENLIDLIKRYDIVLLDKVARDANVKIQPIDD